MSLERRSPVWLLALGLALTGCGRAQEPASTGAGLYASSGCGLCHGPKGRGDGPLVAAGRVKPVDLTDVSAYRYGRAPDAVVAVIASGRSSDRGIMPPHAHLPEAEQRMLATYVLQLSQPAAGTPDAKEKR